MVILHDIWNPWHGCVKCSDVVFFLLTKRPQRVRECLPPDWGSGWDNIFFNVTCGSRLICNGCSNCGKYL